MTLLNIQKNALQLSEKDRATLAAELLSSLPPVLNDPDEGLAEAKRRARELDEGPSLGVTWEEIKQELGR